MSVKSLFSDMDYLSNNLAIYLSKFKMKLDYCKEFAGDMKALKDLNEIAVNLEHYSKLLVNCTDCTIEK